MMSKLRVMVGSVFATLAMQFVVRLLIGVWFSPHGSVLTLTWLPWNNFGLSG